MVEKLILNRIKKLKFSWLNWTKEQMCGIAHLVKKQIMWLFESLVEMTKVKLKKSKEKEGGIGWEASLTC